MDIVCGVNTLDMSLTDILFPLSIVTQPLSTVAFAVDGSRRQGKTMGYVSGRYLNVSWTEPYQPYPMESLRKPLRVN